MAASPLSNLDFESANLPLLGPGQSMVVPVAQAIPAWDALVGVHPVSQVLYNDITLGEAAVCIFGPNNFNPGLVPQGRYALFLIAGLSPQDDFAGTNVVIRQRGVVPSESRRVEFLANTPSVGVSVNGIALGITALSHSGQFTRYGADVSAFAGQEVNLAFTSFYVPPTGGAIALDDIRFEVPEPNTLPLLGLFVLAPWLVMRRARRKAMRIRHVIGWGYGAHGETNAPSNLTNAMHVSAGHHYSLALCNDGRVVAWGWNEYGQTNVPTGLGDTYAVSAGAYHAAAIAYNPILDYPVDPAQDLLLVYNTNSPYSIAVKDYYLAHRPLVHDANVLGVDGSAAETYATRTEFTNGLLTPLLDWYEQTPTKRPHYIVCFLDVPTRVENSGFGGVSVGIRRALGRRPPIVTYINMGAATNTPDTDPVPDCFSYIDKLARFGSNCSPGKVVISASAGGYSNDTYVLDDENRYFQYPPNPPPTQFGGVVMVTRDALLAQGVNSNHVDYIPNTPADHRYGTNVAGYMSWGMYGWQSFYALQFGAVRFLGDAGWYIMATIESYNGIRTPSGGHGNYTEWFWRNAFGRTNGEGTPVGAVCHVSEPHLVGVRSGPVYFGLWARGKYFGTCAWESARTTFLLVVGDPLVRR